MSRRGQAEMLEWLPRLLMMLVAVIVIVMLVRYFVLFDFNDANIHRGTYLYRMYYDDDLLAYRDPDTGRSYPGTIDLATFTSEHLSEGYEPNGKIASKLTLKGECVPGDLVTIAHDNETFIRYAGLAQFGTTGPGGATTEERIFPVTIKNGEEWCPGALKITVARANS